MTELDQLTKHLAALERRVLALENQLALNARADRLLTTKELAALIGYSYYTLKRWRTEGTGGPPYCKGKGRRGAVRYRVSAVNKWLAKLNRTPVEL